MTWATSATEVGRPVPRLTAWPTAASDSSASRMPWTMSETCVKSRDCSPSSKMIGGRPLSRREAKMAATPVYGLESAWPGP